MAPAFSDDMDLHKATRAFLDNCIHGMVLQATTQRASIYAGTATDADREAVRRSLRRELIAVENMYVDAVSDEIHVANIERLATTLSELHPEALLGRRFRIGPAQKALNLLLKFQWCCGWIPTPPHCPFDAVVIQLLNLRHPVAWTKLDTVAGYKELVAEGRKAARGLSLSEWELTEYNQAAPASRRAEITIRAI